MLMIDNTQNSCKIQNRDNLHTCSKSRKGGILRMNADQFDLDVKVKSSSDGEVEPNTVTTSSPCVQTIIISVRFCTRITCRGCF